MCSKFATILIFMLFQSFFCLNNRSSFCSQMYYRIYEGYIPQGNSTAGSYLLIENVTNLDDCVSKCCGIGICNAVMTYNGKCYILNCDSNEKCLPMLHHDSTIRDNITMVLVRPKYRNESWESILKTQDTKMLKESCPKLYQYTYKGFLPSGNESSGNIAHIDKITDLKNCVLKCCEEDKCNVAIMIDLNCYNIECKSSKLCIPALHHNITIRKSFSMVLVKPVNPQENWKNILNEYNENNSNLLLTQLSESKNERNGEELFSEISSNGRQINPIETERKQLKIKLSDKKSSGKIFNFVWTQIEGPTKLEFLQTSKTEFDIKSLTTGNYTIKLSVKDEEKSKNTGDFETTETATEVEPTTASNENITITKQTI